MEVEGYGIWHIDCSYVEQKVGSDKEFFQPPLSPVAILHPLPEKPGRFSQAPGHFHF